MEDFWALKDVSFEVKQGEAVGIIGRNGAGKSTLLKVLGRITEPTIGRVEIDGRVSSLLEVGTGFHPELTGRENIYLNGSILGMSRREVTRKFDEIVDFAEIEKFLDTPVKRYSSGMYMRLAFAVAAHLEPEVMIVDEVLAVGDAQFQRKCLGRLQNLNKSGRTVLFVSHNLGSLSALCDRGILLSAGRVVAEGPIANVLHQYGDLQKGSTVDSYSFAGPLKNVSIQGVLLNGQSLSARSSVRSEEDIHLEAFGTCEQHIRDFKFTIALRTSSGDRLLTINEGPKTLNRGAFRLRFDLPRRLLRPGEYSLALGGRKTSGDEWFWGENLSILEVIPTWSDEYPEDDFGLINLKSFFPGLLDWSAEG
jgi:lipopolysaccharide transport system ATP-binding protein